MKWNKFIKSSLIEFQIFSRTPLNVFIEEFTADSLQNILEHPSFRVNQKLVLFHYDVGETARNQHVLEVITSSIYAGTHNIVSVDFLNPQLVSDEVSRN
jgi:hypothetical protein